MEYYDMYSYPKKVVIEEYRAATDDSVRLLREMESKAKEEVLKVVKLDNNYAKCVIHYHKDFLSGTRRYLVMYELNGKKDRIELDVMDFSFNLEDTIGLIIKKLSENIAIGILNETKNINEVFGGLV